jgi:hypothetical protein
MCFEWLMLATSKKQKQKQKQKQKKSNLKHVNLQFYTNASCFMRTTCNLRMSENIEVKML